MVVATAVMGKDGQNLGDLLEGFDADPPLNNLQAFVADPHTNAASLLGKATTRIVYDLDRFNRCGQPPFAAALARETHFAEPGGAQSKIQISFSYSDGFGREIQKKVQAESGDAPQRGAGVTTPSGDLKPGDLVRGADGKLIEAPAARRWVGTGRTVFNNKGKPVRQYEPFFSSTNLYEEEREMTDTGVSPVIFYDPVGRVIATLHPNQTYEKVVFDPWQQSTYDVNDTATLDPRTDGDIAGYVAAYFATQPANWQTWYAQRIGNQIGAAEHDAAQKAAAHANTPAVAHLDTLGRTFLTIADNGVGQNNAPQKYDTRVVFDIEGAQRAVIDARDRVVMCYDYDMLGARIHQASMEAGERWMLNDVTGKPIRVWDSRRFIRRMTYDGLRRPIGLFVTENGVERLAESTVALAETTPGSSGVVSGSVSRGDGQPFSGGIVRAFHAGEIERAVRLGEDMIDAAGRYTIRYDPIPGVSSVNLCVEVSDEAGKLLQASAVIPQAKSLEIVNLVIPGTDGEVFQVAGNTTLNLPNISAIFRRGYLARKLQLSVREFLLLTSLTGLDPFAPPDLTNPAIAQLIALTQALKDRSINSADALYLIWNQDLSGKSAPEPAQMTEFARTLRGDFVEIEEQFAVIEDAGGDVARARMALAYGQEVSDTFFALLDNTQMFDVAYTHPASALETVITTADTRIAYDNFRHRLSYLGVLTAARRDVLKSMPGVTTEFQDAVNRLFARSEDFKGSFFGRYPELKPLYDTYIASADPPATKRSALAAAFRPALARQRKRQQALQRLGSTAGIDLISTQTLLDPPGAQFPIHAAGHVNQPALNDVIALETEGLAAQFFFHGTADSGGPSVLAVANLDYASGGDNPLPANPSPGASVSGIWSGKIETPEAGFYNFIIETDAGTTDEILVSVRTRTEQIVAPPPTGTAIVQLSVGGRTISLTQNGNIYRNTTPLELKAGTLYDFELKVEKLKYRLSVKWETPKRAREVIPSRYLYPPAIFTPFFDVYSRFLKAISLAAGLDLTTNEIAHFAIDSDCSILGDGWLNALPVSGATIANAATALLKPLMGLLDYARIKAEVSPGDESLLTILQDPALATAKAEGLFFTLIRCDSISLNSVLTHFGGNLAGLKHFGQFSRVYDALSLIRKMGISASALIKATANEPTGVTVRDFQSALRAQFDAADWRDLVQPINDAMRGLQRDALVAYILHQMRSNPASEHIDTPEKLFEYFLMDVQMEPSMQTSRIRHALSSAQLFIERCLMNLEPRVDPGSINADQWEWMKRYRVWEANRKVFLYPENWLEPELRDDKSPFFKEIESELLQSDITEDAAAAAVLNYLSKLDEVAKLEPCGIHHVPADQSERTSEIDHIIARTSGANRKYYYRRREDSYWTPWEQINLDIEDNPVMPYVWNGRLLLFWLRIIKQAPIDPNGLSTSSTKTGNITQFSLSELKIDAKAGAKANTKMTVQAVLCWSEYYNGKWQPTKTSDLNRPTFLWKYDAAGSGAFDRSKYRLGFLEESNALRVVIAGDLPSSTSSFLLHNTHSVPLPAEDAPPGEFWVLDAYLSGPTRSITLPNNLLTISYYPKGNYNYADFNYLLLSYNPLPGRVIATERWSAAQDRWSLPFFYEDNRHTFFVTTTIKEDTVPNYSGYGVTINPDSKQAPEIPPLILQSDSHLLSGPAFWSERGVIGSDPGVTDPTPMRQFV
jgi:hypothetical protein